jgi:hypothetical protein
MASTQPQVPFNEKATEDRLERPGSRTPDTPGSEEERKKMAFDTMGDEAMIDEDAPPAVIIPLKYRITAIVLIILFGTGNTYAGFVLGPLKTRLVRELKITSESISIFAEWRN